jgi:hypothetical protein
MLDVDGLSTDESNERPLPSAIRITDPTYRGSPRHFLGDERFVLKAPRRDGARALIEEWVNELVTFRLAVRLQVPVPETAVKRMPNGDLHLASAFYSELDLLHVPAQVRSQIANIGELPGLMVLDQLVFNMDRREDHIMLTSDPRTTPNALWYAIDHGHAFRGPDGSGLTVDIVDQLAKQIAPVNIDYGIQYYSDFAPWLQRLSQLGDVAIDALVLDVVNGIVAQGVTVDVRVRLEFRGEVLRALLKRRKGALPALLQNWCKMSGKPDAPLEPRRSEPHDLSTEQQV